VFMMHRMKLATSVFMIEQFAAASCWVQIKPEVLSRFVNECHINFAISKLCPT
jgi:hypothetical protein